MTGEVMAMAVTKSFKETVRSRAQSDKDFRDALFREAHQTFRSGESDLGQAILRDYLDEDDV